MIENWLLGMGKEKRMQEVKTNVKQENSQAPDLLKLIKVLNEMGYEILKFENVTPEPKNYKDPDETYDLRIVHRV